MTGYLAGLGFTRGVGYWNLDWLGPELDWNSCYLLWLGLNVLASSGSNWICNWEIFHCLLLAIVPGSGSGWDWNSKWLVLVLCCYWLGLELEKNVLKGY